MRILCVVPARGGSKGVPRRNLRVHGVGAVATPVVGHPEILPAAAMTAHDDHHRIVTLVAEQWAGPGSAADPAGRLAGPRAAVCAPVAEVYRVVAGRS